jgi:hypothetical protein
MPRLIVAVAVLLTVNSDVRAEVAKDRRSDAMLLFVAVFAPLAMKDYCEKHVGQNQALRDAAERFILRHALVVKRISTELGLTEAQLRSGLQIARKTADDSLSGVSNRAAFCQRAAAFIEQGQLDLRVDRATSEALRRLGID